MINFGGIVNLGELTQLDWRTPWWLALALQPWLMWGLLRLRRGKIFHYADAHLLPWVLRGSFSTATDRWRNLANVLAWLLLACAAAGPRLPLLTTSDQRTSIARHEINLMIVLDVSPSMLADDVSPQRLQRARLKLLDLLPRLRGEHIGLIVYSASAGLLMPLSRDQAVLPYYLALAEPGLFETTGSNLSAALVLARQTLLTPHPGQVSGQPGAVLLLTDGDVSAMSAAMKSAANTAAEQLAQAGLPLYVLGVGTKPGATIPSSAGGVMEHEGSAITSRLDAAYLSTLAGLGGGKYANIEDGSSDWDSLYQHGIATVPAGQRADHATQAWQQLFGWFLLPAWLLLLFVYFPLYRFKLRPETAGWLLVGVLVYATGLTPSHAVDNPAQDAYMAYRNGHYVEAQARYDALHGYAASMGSGATAYRRQHYMDAINHFTTAMLVASTPTQRADALYNLGNSYFATGNFRTAADAYLAVLKLRPRDANAAANLALNAGRWAAVKQRNAINAGILGRRGNQVGGELNQEINNRPVTMKAEKEQTGPEIDLSGQKTPTDEARLQGQISNPAANLMQSELAYRAALKKRELITDRPAQLQKQLLKLDTPRNSTDSGELLPW